MPLLDEILEANRAHVSTHGDVGTFVANRHLCIVTCVDPRLTRFFPDVLGVERGHAVAIRVPGAHIRAGSEAMRGLAATVYVNDCQEIIVVGHTDCGVTRVGEAELRRVMRARGVADGAIPADVAGFFGLFPDVAAAVRETVQAIRGAPYLPKHLPVHGVVMDIRTGALKLLERGYDAVFR